MKLLILNSDTPQPNFLTSITFKHLSYISTNRMKMKQQWPGRPIVLYTIQSLFRFTSATGEPQLHVATSDFFPSEIGWAMTPGCPFRDKFNQQIRRLVEAGFLTRWLNQLIHDPGRREAQEPQEPQQAEGAQQPLTLDHVQGAYYVLFIGCIVSCPMFLLEVAWFYLYSSHPWLFPYD